MMCTFFICASGICGTEPVIIFRPGNKFKHYEKAETKHYKKKQLPGCQSIRIQSQPKKLGTTGYACDLIVEDVYSAIKMDEVQVRIMLVV